MSKKDQPIRIVIADDHSIFRDGLKSLISKEAEFQVVGEAADGNEALNVVTQRKPDVLLLDMIMPKADGLAVLPAIASCAPETKIVVISGVLEGDDIYKAFELGARGVVMKDMATSVLFNCIRAVADGKYWTGRKAVDNLEAILMQSKSASRKANPQNYGLTPREMEIIEAVVSGQPNKKIASQLSISEQTVKHHITNIFDKLGIYNRLELALFVFHHGILKNVKKS